MDLGSIWLPCQARLAQDEASDRKPPAYIRSCRVFRPGGGRCSDWCLSCSLHLVCLPVRMEEPKEVSGPTQPNQQGCSLDIDQFASYVSDSDRELPAERDKSMHACLHDICTCATTPACMHVLYVRYIRTQVRKYVCMYACTYVQMHACQIAASACLELWCVPDCLLASSFVLSFFFF